jgi:hypothetical protein
LEIEDGGLRIEDGGNRNPENNIRPFVAKALQGRLRLASRAGIKRTIEMASG